MEHIATMPELQIRYEAEAAALTTVGDLGLDLARERLESAGWHMGCGIF